MFKRRSTLDPIEKIRKNRQTEILLELDKCLRMCNFNLEIPNDDKMYIRKKIKDYDECTIAIFDAFKREKNYS